MQLIEIYDAVSNEAIHKFVTTRPGFDKEVENRINKNVNIKFNSELKPVQPSRSYANCIFYIILFFCLYAFICPLLFDRRTVQKLVIWGALASIIFGLYWGARTDHKRIEREQEHNTDVKLRANKEISKILTSPAQKNRFVNALVNERTDSSISLFSDDKNRIINKCSSMDELTSITDQDITAAKKEIYKLEDVFNKRQFGFAGAQLDNANNNLVCLINKVNEIDKINSTSAIDLKSWAEKTSFGNFIERVVFTPIPLGDDVVAITSVLANKLESIIAKLAEDLDFTQVLQNHQVIKNTSIIAGLTSEMAETLDKIHGVAKSLQVDLNKIGEELSDQLTAFRKEAQISQANQAMMLGKLNNSVNNLRIEACTEMSTINANICKGLLADKLDAFSELSNSNT